jgi:sulfate permease, SulP family
LQTLTKAEERLRERGVTLWLTALNPQALHAVNRSDLGRALGKARMYFNLADAVTAFEQRSALS